MLIHVSIVCAAFTARMKRFNRDHMAQNAENIYYLAFRKSVPTSVLDSPFRTKLTEMIMLETFSGCPQVL